jgi:hypothetical protein
MRCLPFQLVWLPRIVPEANLPQCPCDNRKKSMNLFTALFVAALAGSTLLQLWLANRQR